MKISIALCTYNGGDYVGLQLDSLLSQTRLPDEMIVCDDRSADSTLDHVNAFASRATFPVRVVVNDATLGATRNFEQAIAMTSGDVVCLCDQDDRWLPQKLETIERTLEASPQVGYVFSDGHLIDAAGRRSGSRLWQMVGFTRAEQARFDRRDGMSVLFHRNVVTGATMAFRREWLDLVMPISPHWVHDGWIAVLVEAVAPGYCIREPLIEYRRHERQAVGVRRRSTSEAVAWSRHMGAAELDACATAYGDVAERLAARGAGSPELLARLNRKVAHFRSRAAVRRGDRGMATIGRELLSGRYHGFAFGLRSAASDALARRRVEAEGVRGP